MNYEDYSTNAFIAREYTDYARVEDEDEDYQDFVFRKIMSGVDAYTFAVEELD